MENENTTRVKRAWIVLLVGAMLLGFIFVSAALAATIVVDGDPGDWIEEMSLGLDGTGPDVVDNGVPPAENLVDIREVFFTNDANNLYWRFDTWGSPTRWTPVQQFAAPSAQICMNTDDDTMTGQTIEVCNKQEGVDYYLMVEGSVSGSINVFLYNCKGGSCSLDATASVAAATANAVTEASVSLTDLGITGPCDAGSSCQIPSALYFDNEDTPDPDNDNVPNTGFLVPEIPGPTAVTLSEVYVRPKYSTIVPLGFVGVLILVAVFGAYYRLGRRRTS